MNSSKHEHLTGVPNELILDNLTKISGKGVPFEVRMPLIAGINDDPDSIREMIDFLLSLKKRPKLSFLPYHRGGCEKHHRLGIGSAMKTFNSPSERKMAKIMKQFYDHGFSVKRGG
jgi:pyruvate formate lyase activating enzyme